ncbi:hypothetical protein ACFXA2_00255 [Micromonospora chalcea]|uniref:Uncharacterized protein n=1 Tax=Micromonospora echinospora TaxID=1877 RepID=A0ABR6MD43_MICEC|nr:MULTISPECIES: hypothetical protein [Micromonospora]AXO37025.1 hypothetical protein MicB006_4763 [Micromonospora sp. B006]MBB5112536.1 hypothetical protein [Micromonospora echinospora]
MRHPARVHVQDHGFLVTDRDVDTVFGTMDYSTGLAGVMASAALLYAGIDRGHVLVTAEPFDERPALETGTRWNELDSWEDVAEVSLYVPNGHLTVEELEQPPEHERVSLPMLSIQGPGHYRLRIHASGRDRHYDQVLDQSDERFHLIAWPEPPAPPLIIKAGSRCGYGLRLAPLPLAPPPPEVTQDEDAEAKRQAMQLRNLLDG